MKNQHNLDKIDHLISDEENKDIIGMIKEIDESSHTPPQIPIIEDPPS
jgi:hypothetical protein